MTATSSLSRIRSEMTCIRYMLFVANFMFVLVAFLLLTIGYTIKSIYENFDVFMEQYHYRPSSLAISIGFIIFIVAFFGCVAAVRRSVFLVNLYSLFLTCILILQISVCIASYSMRNNIAGNIEGNMRRTMINYDSSFNQYTWNATQFNLRCCGINDATDWAVYWDNYKDLESVTLSNNDTLYVPDTCCPNQVCLNFASVYTNGCLSRLTRVISECTLLLSVGALCVSFIQLLGIIFGLMLAKSLRKLKTQILVEEMKQQCQIYDEKNATKSEKIETPVLYTPTSSEA